MRDSKVVGIVAGLATLSAWATLWIVNRGGFGPSFDPTPHQASGWVLARQALGLLKPGGQIVVITRDTAAFKNPASDAQLAGFTQGLNEGHATAAKTLALQVDPLRPIEVPAGDFFELMRRTPPGSVIVSFMGPPLLTEAQRKQLGEATPAVVAFCPGGLPERVDLKTLFDEGLLRAAVISRKNPNRTASPPKGLQGAFDEFFRAVTAANASELSVRADAPGGTN